MYPMYIVQRGTLEIRIIRMLYFDAIHGILVVHHCVFKVSLVKIMCIGFTRTIEPMAKKILGFIVMLFVLP